MILSIDYSEKEYMLQTTYYLQNIYLYKPKICFIS